jgi:hypothetical protein
MTTICRIVLTVVTCTTNPDLPKPSPAEAVAILSAGGRQFFVPESIPPWERYGGDDNYPRTYDRDEMIAVGFATTFASNAASGPRRLDGTSIDDPPAVYGALPFHGYGTHGLYGGNNAIVSGYYYGPPRRGVHERARGSSDRVSREAPERPGRDSQPQRPTVVRGATVVPAGAGGVRVRR